MGASNADNILQNKLMVLIAHHAQFTRSMSDRLKVIDSILQAVDSVGSRLKGRISRQVSLSFILTSEAQGCNVNRRNK